MRNRSTLLLSLLLGCGGSSPPRSAESRHAVVTSTSMTDAEQQSTMDSARAWIAPSYHQWEQGDSAGLMASYPSAGPLVTANDGNLVTSRDSVAGFFAGLGQTTGRRATYDDAKINVLAPGVAAVTTTYRLRGARQGKKFDMHGVYSAVLAERDARIRLIQEHQSSVQEPSK
jgi:hypothetical protein